MPVIEVHLLEGYSAQDKQRLSEALTDATRLVVPAPAELITIMTHEMPASNYCRGRTMRTPAPALPDPCAVVEHFLNYLGRRELDKARECCDSDFQMVFPDTAPMHSLHELIEWSKQRYTKIEKHNMAFEALHAPGDETIVYCTGTLSGEFLDATEFNNVRFIDRFELINGKITRQQVWNDLGEVMRKR